MNSRCAGILAGARILVVEDDPFIAMELQDRLSERGAEVMGPVPAVRAALRILETSLPDAAVLDVNLRGEMSTPVAAVLSAAAVPFVLVTGYSRKQLDPDLQDAILLPKPFSSRELAGVLEGLLAERSERAGRGSSGTG